MKKFAPLFAADAYTEEEKKLLAPFFTNVDSSVYAPLIFSPELIGALCSRASRAKGDLRRVFLDEFIVPFLNPERTDKDTDDTWDEKVRYGEDLRAFIEFAHRHPTLDLFANPRARSFYIRWLAQYGDDSIAQMAGSHLAFWGLSQVAIKHLEDQRIGLAPIEKSTRYVDYSEKVNGRYMYYTDPTLEAMGLKDEYERVMDNLFITYTDCIARMKDWLARQFPEEKEGVREKKAFDLLRGLLPSSTLSQVAFFGNGQAFEHMINRSRAHRLGEVRWVGARALEELSRVTPSFLRRLQDEEKRELVEEYQEYLAGKGDRVAPLAHVLSTEGNDPTPMSSGAQVRLVEYDLNGEDKVIAGMLYSSPGVHCGWDDVVENVGRMSDDEKKEVIRAYLGTRSQRWQKVGRAFENAYVRFDILMNIGAWRDLHRHRMLTQQRQYFSCRHGYDVPSEVDEAGLGPEFRGALDSVGELYEKIASHDPDIAQYATALAHRVRFMQWKNVRECFWEIELRTIPEGHPDYRHVEQQKFALLKEAYPLLAEYMLVNIGEYDFARRGQEERIQKKLSKLS